jgi:hypothetical protein
MKKILLLLQYWNGDRDMAMKLARIIADLQPNHCDLADFMFFSRFDTSHDLKTEQHVQRKFNIWSATNNRRSAGWPHGCNDLWFGAMDWVYSQQEAKRVPEYKAIFTFEADGVPLTTNWIAELHHAWDEQQQKKPTYVYGPLLKFPDEHINGNALFSGDRKFIYWLARRQAGCAPHQGWDYALKDKFRSWGWANCPIMQSYWRKETIGEEEFQQEIQKGTVYIHGIKDLSGMELCQKIYNLPVS